MWNRLHRLAYVAAAAGVIHYYLLVKADITKPVAFGVVVAGLLAYRVANKYLPEWTQRKPARVVKV
jgi:DMSO/TMAO reductase YedYZ heme-binding membrane subunit